MFRCFKEAFNIAYENLICISPLILFMIVLSLYLGAAKISIVNALSLCMTIFTLIIMFAIFFAGWFYMVKMAIINSRFSLINIHKDFELLKLFPAGVADYFLTFIYFIFCAAFILIFIYTIDYAIAIKFIGKVEMELKLYAAIKDLTNLRYLFADLTYEQIIKLSGWLFLYVVSTIIYLLFTLMWIPYIVFKTKNVFLALWYSTKDAFTSPKILTLLLSLIVINCAFAVINAYIMLNPLIFFIMTILYIFFIVHMSMLIFLYYDKKYTYEHEED